MRVQGKQAKNGLFRQRGATLLSRGLQPRQRQNTSHPFFPLPRVYFTFLVHRHFLHLSRSDIDWKRGIEFGPFWSLREFLLVNQKVL